MAQYNPMHVRLQRKIEEHNITRMFRRLYVKWLARRGKAIDVWSKSSYPANVLSNLYPNVFEIDGVRCASMEGFLQALKYEDCEVQKEICSLSGKEAKERSISDWQNTQTIYWQGKPIKRHSTDYQNLLLHAFLCLFEQNRTFRSALLFTKDKTLYHTKGLSNPQKTILTEQEFCSILTELRNNSRE